MQRNFINNTSRCPLVPLQVKGYKVGKLYGVGVGPGDSELLTLKAKRILNEVDVIFCPEKEAGSGSFAFEIIERHLENPDVEIVNLVYPMHYGKDELHKAWQHNGEAITERLKGNESGAFIVLGDTTVYSTFMYTLPYIDEKQVELELVPGITSFSAIASQLKIPLVAWEENLVIAPVRKKESAELEAVIKNNDNIVLMKVSNDPKQIIKMLKNEKLENSFFFVSKAGTEEEVVITSIDDLENTKLPYLSTLIIKKGEREC